MGRHRPLLAIALAAACATAHAQANAPAWRSDRIDHVMLWTDDIDRTTSVFAVKLGFQVRPGGDFGDGVANLLVRIADDGYIELLYTTRAQAELDADLRKELAAVRAGTGARTFAVHPQALDSADAFLRARGFELNPPSPSTYDPDGAGPQPPQPAKWRTVSFAKSPFSFGDLFLIDYGPDQATPTQLTDRALAREHPNGARAWTSIWLLCSDLKADAAQMVRMGFTQGADVELPQVAGHGVRLSAGADSILLVEPQGDGIAARSLAKRGPHVFGLSLGVDDLARAQRRVERGYGVTLSPYQGTDGNSFLAPTDEDLGLFIEFHALPPAAATGK